ncbi:helicase-related protein, partial [Escherichia coli]|uniref:helicase-related protein n=1 Tax=Escherichia coli TaxID=562 RepID=UPI0021F32D7A
IKESAIRLISKLEGKTIVFATSIDLLEVVLKENIVSNRNTASVNKTIIDNFNKGIIKNIGSFKMLQRGITLEGVENIVILSYYSKEHL